ncbi:OmpA family protein [uncultured Photobacterium sp.]|uniref:OmpA family protein n=1 Tax=uncultured Photobacterium sp. TaxID=173973 RepID=UPI00260D4536|nr:OmpA family protein [uncultured Photobacterium sp.]
MAKNSLDLDRIYLMGRLFGRNGQPVGRHFPLPFETLRLPESELIKQHRIDTKGQASVQVKAEYPIAYSDKNGALTYFNSAKQYDGNELSLTGVPVIRKLSQNENVSLSKTQQEMPKIQQKMLFFPSYLVPMCHDSYEGNWLKNLNSFLSDKSVVSDKQYFKNAITRVNVSNLLPLPVDKNKAQALADSDDYFKNYQTWLGEHRHLQANIIEVPQFYTIVVTFSSAKFEGATVTITDIPLEFNIMGSEKECQSLVGEVEFLGADGQPMKQQMATFWIESDAVLTSQNLKQYCRINVDLNSVRRDVRDEFEIKGLPLTYSLCERVFHLPIKTALGRTTLVNGDPVSVEEALVNHAPEYYQHLVAQLSAQPNALPENLAKDNKAGSGTLPEQAWHTLQSQKGLLEAGAGALEKGLSWTTISKVFSASASSLTSSQDQGLKEFGQSLLAVAGVTGGSMAFMGTLADLHDKGLANGLTEKAKLIDSKMKKVLLAGDPISPHVRYTRSLLEQGSGNVTFPLGFKPFMAGIGKAGSFLLGKPLSIAETLFNIYQVDQQVAKAKAADSDLLSYVSYYSNTVISASEDRLKAFESNGSSLTETEQNAIEELRKQLAEMVVKDSEGEHRTKNAELINGTLLRLDSTRFGFDKASPNFANESVKNAYKRIAVELAKLSSPIEVTISGHTCDIGAREYNLELSRKRAEAVKLCILESLSDSQKVLWEPMIKIVAYGETVPLVENDSIENRRKNRRVELLLNFSAQFDFPPCRSGLMAVEKASKKAIASDMAMDEALVSAINSVVDLALLGASAVFPPVSIVAAGKEGINLAMSMIDTASQLLDKNQYKAQSLLTKLRHKDLVLINKFLAETTVHNLQTVMLKAYMKRAMAINGLLRLIQTYRFNKSKTGLAKNTENVGPATLTATYGQMKTAKEFEDIDVVGYIKTYLLSDEWEVEVSALGIMYLDEVWLNTRGFKARDDFSFKGLIAQGRAVISQLTGSDEQALLNSKAQRNSRYFPVHYLASDTDEHFKSLVAEPFPDNLDKDVFLKDRIVVSVRQPYATEGNGSQSSLDGWELFDDYYAKNQHQLTPYDNIRIVIVVDKEKAQIKDDSCNLFPVALRVMSCNSNQSWQLFNRVASEHIEYAGPLAEEDLTDAEKAIVFKDIPKDESVYGVIIQPSYFFGMYQIMGIRPVADYDDPVMKSLFDEKSESTLSGKVKWLLYYLQILVPSVDDTKLDVELVKSSYSDRRLPRFNMTLSPVREYRFTKDFKTYSPVQKGDRVFYEKSFLSLASPKQELKFPEVFNDAEFDFYLGQAGLNKPTFQKSQEKQDANDALIASGSRLRGVIEDFDWDKEASATLVVRSKPKDPVNLKNAGFDENCIPLGGLSIQLNHTLISKSLPMTDVHCLYRLGQIVSKDDTFEFVPTLYDGVQLPRPVALLADKLGELKSEALSEMALDGKLWGKEEDKTDVFANVVDLSYLNIFGVKVKGLRPLYLPSNYASEGASFNVVINGSKGAGLSGCESNEIIMRGRLNSYPRNWYKVEREDEIMVAKEQLKTNSEAKLYNSKKRVKDKEMMLHPVSKLMEWMAYSDYVNVITSEREDMIEAWADI